MHAYACRPSICFSNKSLHRISPRLWHGKARELAVMHQIVHRTQRTRWRRREHEREWQGRCVDHNLKDKWLEKLNAIVDLTSQVSARDTSPVTKCNEQRPSVNFRLKAAFINPLITEWTALHSVLDCAAAECFHNVSTYYEFELRLGTRSARNGQRRKEEFVVKLRSTTP